MLLTTCRRIGPHGLHGLTCVRILRPGAGEASQGATEEEVGVTAAPRSRGLRSGESSCPRSVVRHRSGKPPDAGGCSGLGRPDRIESPRIRAARASDFPRHTSNRWSARNPPSVPTRCRPPLDRPSGRAPSAHLPGLTLVALTPTGCPGDGREGRRNKRDSDDGTRVPHHRLQPPFWDHRRSGRKITSPGHKKGSRTTSTTTDQFSPHTSRRDSRDRMGGGSAETDPTGRSDLIAVTAGRTESANSFERNERRPRLVTSGGLRTQLSPVIGFWCQPSTLTGDSRGNEACVRTDALGDDTVHRGQWETGRVHRSALSSCRSGSSREIGADVPPYGYRPAADCGSSGSSGRYQRSVVSRSITLGGLAKTRPSPVIGWCCQAFQTTTGDRRGKRRTEGPAAIHRGPNLCHKHCVAGRHHDFGLRIRCGRSTAEIARRTFREASIGEMDRGAGGDALDASPSQPILWSERRITSPTLGGRRSGGRRLRDRTANTVRKRRTPGVFTARQYRNRSLEPGLIQRLRSITLGGLCGGWCKHIRAHISRRVFPSGDLGKQHAVFSRDPSPFGNGSNTEVPARMIGFDHPGYGGGAAKRLNYLLSIHPRRLTISQGRVNYQFTPLS